MHEVWAISKFISRIISSRRNTVIDNVMFSLLCCQSLSKLYYTQSSKSAKTGMFSVAIYHMESFINRPALDGVYLMSISELNGKL